MDSDERLVYRILEAARVVHGTLGPGFIEGIYSRALLVEMKNNGFHVDRERLIKIWYGASLVGKHRLDLLVDRSIVVELKANRGIVPVHIAQMISYLDATNYRVGLLLNFGAIELQWEIVRANKNPDEPFGSSGFC